MNASATERTPGAGLQSYLSCGNASASATTFFSTSSSSLTTSDCRLLIGLLAGFDDEAGSAAITGSATIRQRTMRMAGTLLRFIASPLRLFDRVSANVITELAMDPKRASSPRRLCIIRLGERNRHDGFR